MALRQRAALLFFLLAGWLTTDSLAQNTDPLLALTASSPFRMILRPTASELDFEALEIVEEAIASTLFIMQDEKEYIDTEAVIQQVEFVQLENEHPATRIRFFVLATTLARNETPRTELNANLKHIFADSIAGKSQFLTILRGSDHPMLQKVADMAVAPILPAASDENKSGSSRKLSTLDIILIAVSAAIFIGILYMIIQHHRDRGYIENQRVLAFSTPPPRRQDSDRHNSKASNDNKDKKNATNSEDQQDAPSTPSTTNSVDLEFNVAPETPDRVRITPVSNMTPEALLTASSVDGSSVQTLSETFDSKWFQSVSVKKDDRNDDQASSSGESSEDVFHVDVEASSMCPDDKSKTSSTASAAAISEWMRSIQVISSDTKTSEMTPEHASTDSSSQEHSTHEASSLPAPQSLEKSLASSTISPQSSGTGKFEV